MSDTIEPTHLAIAVFRSCVYEIVLCETDLDWDALRRWEFILKGGDVKDYSITRRFQAFARAKQRARNPENIAAYLLYRLSHGGAGPEDGLALGEETTDHQKGTHCISCGGLIDQARRTRMLERIRAGFRMSDLKVPIDCEELVNTHLTQAEMNEFVGHQVSFSYQEKLITEALDELTMYK
ncbi:MAG: hypothetical protein RMJ29_06980 [Candidatus Bipolaricaulota bacterium]|nr:hypothetical protein [Candidatus Bipolaricaulota bacterium]